MKTYFTGDRYVTPADAPISLRSRLFGWWRWTFYLDYFTEVLNARSLSVRGLYGDAEWAESSFRVLKIIERNRGRFDISGIDSIRNAAADSPYVFVGNHMSALETQVLPVIIEPFMSVTFVVKEKLVTGPVFGPIMASRHPIPVKRVNPREDLETVLREGPERLSRGISIIVFPQSTRKSDLKPEEFNSLGVKLALRAGVKVIPFAVKTDFWGEEGLVRGFGPVDPEKTIHMSFGDPIGISGRGREEHREIIEFIGSRLEEWRTGR